MYMLDDLVLGKGHHAHKMHASQGYCEQLEAVFQLASVQVKLKVFNMTHNNYFVQY